MHVSARFFPSALVNVSAQRRFLGYELSRIPRRRLWFRGVVAVPAAPQQKRSITLGAMQGDGQLF